MNFTQPQKNSLIRQLEEALTAAKAMPVSRSCMDCRYADLSLPLRCKKFGAYPPEDTIAKGCEAYEYDPTSIPL